MKTFLEWIRTVDTEDILAMLSAPALIAMLWLLAYGSGFS